MAKTKEQKRLEAHQRQRHHLLTVAIPNWVSAMTQGWDAADQKLVNDRLIASAHAANCDRHGNLLDARFYKRASLLNPADTPEGCLRFRQLFSLEAMRSEITHGGKTLYDTAYRF